MQPYLIGRNFESFSGVMITSFPVAQPQHGHSAGLALEEDKEVANDESDDQEMHDSQL
jgi:hypothetical protein